MTVVLINPNSTHAMTQSALAAAKRAAPGLQFEGWTSQAGPASIEGPEDGAAAVRPLLKLVKQASDSGAGVIIIACFDDTGLAEARELAACPVIGIGQASYTYASLLSGPTAVVTTVQAAIPVIKANIASQGHSALIEVVVAANVPVLTLEDDPQTALEGFLASVSTLPVETRNLILGCSGAVSIKDAMEAHLEMSVIDGVTAAARLSLAILE